MYSFSDVIDEQWAQTAIAQLQQSSAVEKVVVQSAFNLEFSAADFSRVYAPNAPIPDEARRGFDWDRVAHPRPTYDPTVQLPLHASDRVIVHWKDEYVWYANQNKNLSQFSDLNALAGCTVLYEQSNSSQDLTQILQFDSVEHSVVDQLLYYQSSNLVDYVQPDYIYEGQTVPNDPIYASKQWSLPKISAPSAWSLTTGSDSVVIAVADTGTNVANTNGHVAHPDFVPNLWSGQNDGDAHNFTTVPF
jgi:hypothetical protein